jgi:hypothetical protein
MLYLVIEDKRKELIWKFSQTKKPVLIKRGLTLQEARDYCTRDDTAGEGWFCGYEAE